MPPLKFSGWRDKSETFVPWTAGRPFVWFDDELGLVHSVRKRVLPGQQYLLVAVDEREGLTAAHLAVAREFLLKAVR
jgi:hypothetical protein